MKRKIRGRKKQRPFDHEAFGTKTLSHMDLMRTKRQLERIFTNSEDRQKYIKCLIHGLDTEEIILNK